MIGIRIKEVRKALKKTQQDFADVLGLKRNTIAGYEIGSVTPSERTIVDICEKYNVNQQWLETGEGEMFIEMSREEEISSFLADVQMGDDSFKKKIVAGLTTLDADDWKNLKTIIEKMAKKMAGEE